MFSIALDVDVKPSGPFREVLGVRARRGRFPILSLRSLCHYDRDCPCNTGYFRSLPFPIASLYPARIIGLAAVFWCKRTACFDVWGRKVDFATRSFQAPCPRCAYNQSGAWWNPTTVRVLRAPNAAFFRSLSPLSLFETFFHMRSNSSYSNWLGRSLIDRSVSGWTDWAQFLTTHRSQISSVSFESRDCVCGWGIGVDPLRSVKVPQLIGMQGARPMLHSTTRCSYPKFIPVSKRLSPWRRKNGRRST